MSDAQEMTIRKYWSLIGLNTSSSAIHAAREAGILKELIAGQKTLGELVQQCDLQMDLTERLLNVLLATGLIEKYGDDYAASQVLKLLSQYDYDLGNGYLNTLGQQLKGEGRQLEADGFRRHSVGRGWTRTPIAMQATVALDIGKTRKGLRVLDLGCGAAVWSVSMAYHDPAMTIVAVDLPDALAEANKMAQSIELGDRWTTYESDPTIGDLPEGPFDLVILPELIQTMDDAAAVTILGRAADVTRPDGEVVVIDMFDFEDEKDRTLATVSHDLELALRTPMGRLRKAPQVSELMIGAGLQSPMFARLDQSAQNIGMLLAKRPEQLS